MAELVPPAIPDEVNFFSSPLFADLTVPSNGTYKYRWEGLKPSAANGEEFSMGVKNSRTSTGLTNLEAFAIQLRTSENKDQPAVKILINALERRPDLWNELYEAAKRPDARFPIQYEKLFKAASPHTLPVMKLSQILSLRSVAYMEMGDSNDAERDLMLVLRISDSKKNEPFLISLLVREAIVNMVPTRIWEGIQRHTWSAEQLKNFENRLATENLLQGLVIALRGERGTFNEACRRMTQRDKAFMSAFFYMRQSDWTKTIDTPWWAFLIPWDGLYSEMAFYSRRIQNQTDVLIHARGVNKDTYPEVIVSSSVEKLKHPLSLQALPTIQSVARKLIETQARIDTARIACALERCKMAKESYPENLNQLVPDFIEKLPNDVASGKSYHYRRNAPDNFTLWSIGFDGVNDNGVQITRNPNSDDVEKGDWVWGVFTKK
ncbi:MAG: hypothetical protein ABI254_00190 [Chthoniobacterales bacterium]